ncbi:hypothetical protein B296_00047835 [Ensete ventricosum]|uniref:Uncharacterized protein n=1 Tax=Ensete ventricosum TaxID=4639 RepID=A0A426XMX1_ENSVE|nr:hypothetical protein B296_00047835 [Ensete ventricosum]
MFDGVVVVEFEDAVAGSCMKKTTTMFAAQVVFYNAMFDGVVIVEFEDVVVGSYTKKTTVRETEGVGSDYDVKQRKSSNRVDMLRKKGWPIVIAGAIEKIDGKGQRAEQQRVERRWAAEARRWLCAAVLTIAGAIRKKRLEEGCDQDLSVVSGNICKAGDRGCQGCGALAGSETGEVVGVGAMVGDFTGECVGASCSVLALGFRRSIIMRRR